MLSRPRRLTSAAVLLVVVAAACGSRGDEGGFTSPEAPRVSVSSTTTEPPTTGSTTGDQPPPEPPPTTRATAPGPPAVAVESAVDIAAASGVVDLPGTGPVLVSTLAGEVLAVDLDSGSREVLLDLTGVVSTGGERGLLDIAVDPDGERLYVNFTDGAGDTDIRSWPMTDGRPVGGSGDGVLHLEIGQPFANHNGGNLEFGPDGLLWIGTGDGGSAGDPDNRAQDPADLLGKMLRVLPDPAGGVFAPADNPTGDGRTEVWGIGLRNPWRYSFDPVTGHLWIADVGQNAVEEVTVIHAASVPADDAYPNFGWNLLEGNDEFAGSEPPAHIPPAITYRHADTDGCSITGGHVYRGEAIDSLYGWYVFGDYCGEWLWAVPADEPTADPVELATGVGQIQSIEVLDDGELLVLTVDGTLRLVPT